jgi:hypothetical protein
MRVSSIGAKELAGSRLGWSIMDGFMKERSGDSDHVATFHSSLEEPGKI